MAGTSRWFGPNARERLGISETLKELLAQTPVVETASFTADADQLDRTTEVNAAAGVTATIPANVFKAGQKLRFVQTGAGLLTFAAGAGLTLNTPTTLKSAGRYSTLVVEFSSPTVAVLSGIIAAT